MPTPAVVIRKTKASKADPVAPRVVLAKRAPKLVPKH
jgi:hypothetical protein